MTTKQKMVLSLGFLHLMLVLLGACHFNLGDRGGVVDSLIAHYAALSGADSGYGFFAPGVGSQLRANFELETKPGKAIVTSLSQGEHREFYLRVSNIISTFFEEVADTEIRQSLAASWAGKVLHRYRDCDTITVKLESYHMPSMGQYRKGARGRWLPFYSAKFSLKN